MCPGILRHLVLLRSSAHLLIRRPGRRQYIRVGHLSWPAAVERMEYLGRIAVLRLILLLGGTVGCAAVAGLAATVGVTLLVSALTCCYNGTARRQEHRRSPRVPIPGLVVLHKLLLGVLLLLLSFHIQLLRVAHVWLLWGWVADKCLSRLAGSMVRCVAAAALLWRQKLLIVVRRRLVLAGLVGAQSLVVVRDTVVMRLTWLLFCVAYRMVLLLLVEVMRCMTLSWIVGCCFCLLAGHHSGILALLHLSSYDLCVLDLYLSCV